MRRLRTGSFFHAGPHSTRKHQLVTVCSYCLRPHGNPSDMQIYSHIDSYRWLGIVGYSMLFARAVCRSRTAPGARRTVQVDSGGAPLLYIVYSKIQVVRTFVH